MFRIDPAPEFTFTAEIPAAGDQPVQKLQLRARHRTQEQLKAWVAAAKSFNDDAAWLAQVLVGWEGVQAADGAQVPFSVDTLRLLLANFLGASDALVEQYCRALRGERQKN